MLGYSPHYRVKTSVASSGERWALIVGEDGMAEEHSTLFATMELRERGLSYNSQVARLQAVATLLSWARRRHVDLNARTGTCDLLDRNEIHDLRKLLRRNSNLDKAVTAEAKRIVPPLVLNATYYNRVHFVAEYLRWHAENVVQRVPAREHARASEMRRRMEDFQKMMVAKLPPSRTGGREAATPEERGALRDAIQPASPLNPFQPELRCRNQALMLLFEDIGLRRGEALALKGEDLVLTGPNPSVRVVLRKDDRDDPRPASPRAKTLAREIPIGAELAALLRDYVLNHRSRAPGAKRTAFVFLTAAGRPLSAQAVNDMYRLLRAQVPGVCQHMSPHVARHDANEAFSDVADEKNMSEAEERQLRNYTFGWTKMSKQGEKYELRRIRQKAGEASLRLQDRAFGGAPK